MAMRSKTQTAWGLFRVLIRAYRAIPLRPHCRQGQHHVLLCRALGLTQFRASRQDCPESGD